MKFTVDELLKAGSHKWDKKDVDDVTLRNLEDLCRKLNILGWVPAMKASSCLRSLADQKRINPNAMGSSHLYGCAVDIVDPFGKLDSWLQTPEGKKALVNAGLFVEHPDSTIGWCHLQTYAPKSFNRTFRP